MTRLSGPVGGLRRCEWPVPVPWILWGKIRLNIANPFNFAHFSALFPNCHNSRRWGQPGPTRGGRTTAARRPITSPGWHPRLARQLAGKLATQVTRTNLACGSVTISIQACAGRVHISYFVFMYCTQRLSE